MTIERLNHHRQLVLDLKRREDTMERAKALLDENADGLPTAQIDAILADLTADVENAAAAVAASEPEVKTYISTVTGIRTRAAMRMRFLAALTWEEVSEAVSGNATAGALRNAVSKYILNNH